MEKIATQVSEKKLEIRISLLKNGVTVSAYPLRKKKECSCEDDCNHPMSSMDYDNELCYVYESIDKMVKELPAFISVLKEQSGLNPDNPTKHEADMGNKKGEDY